MNQEWRKSFFGREKELAWLIEGWESVVKESKPQLRVLISNSGYGKTRLAQRFYTELSQEYDPDKYWPNVLLNNGDNLRVMPLADRCNPPKDAKVPWFWYGLRWADKTDSRNETLTESSIS